MAVNGINILNPCFKVQLVTYTYFWFIYLIIITLYLILIPYYCIYLILYSENFERGGFDFNIIKNVKLF